MEIANQMAKTAKVELPKVMKAPTPAIAEMAVGGHKGDRTKLQPERYLSNDKAFQIVREYWKTVHLNSMMALKPNIISRITSIYDAGKQAALAHREMKPIF